MQLKDSPLDAYKLYLETQIHQVKKNLNLVHGLIVSLQFLEKLRPSRLHISDPAFYEPCATLKGGTCDCIIKNSGVLAAAHWQGQPQETTILLKLPVSNLKELWYNRSLYKWKWSLTILTNKAYSKQAATDPSVPLNLFLYPVDAEYLTPSYSEWGLREWLKLVCPDLKPDFELVRYNTKEVMEKIK